MSEQEMGCCAGLAVLKAQSDERKEWVAGIDKEVMGLRADVSTMKETLSMFKWIIGASIPATGLLVTVIFKVMEK